MGSVHLMAAMLGSGRNQLSRSILRQVTAKNGRDARSLASLVNISAGKEIVKSGVTGVSKQPQVWESIYRGLRTTPALGNEIKEVVCPAFADSISEGNVRWEKQVGDSVAEDDVLCEIETDKTSVPVPSPAAGVIEELLVEDGATVSPGTKLLKLKLGAGGAPKAKPAAAPAETPAPAAAAPVVRMPPADPTTSIAGTRSEHRVK